MTVFVMHVIASLGFDAYDSYPRLDIPMHFLGGVSIAYFFHRASLAASAHGLLGRFHRVTHIVLVFALTCTATVFWEFAEFVTDRYLRTNAQIGLDDTLKDMFFGTCGGVALLIAVAFAGLHGAEE